MGGGEVGDAGPGFGATLPTRRRIRRIWRARNLEKCDCRLTLTDDEAGLVIRTKKGEEGEGRLELEIDCSL